jgi:NADPH:quinone reductase
VTEAGKSQQAWTVLDYGGVLERTSQDQPTPGPHEVLVKVEAAALNPLDLKMMRGDLKAFMPTPFPFTPGSDICGTVAAVGDGVDSYRLGDRVVALTPAHGGMSTHVICRVGPSTTAAPEGVSAVELASLPEAGLTALAIVEAAAVAPGVPVAVIGATGGIGLLLCQQLARTGPRSSPRPRRRTGS